MLKSLLIGTFALWENNERTAINGMIEPMLSFFKPQVKHIDLIDGPHPGSSTVITKYETYSSGKKMVNRVSVISILMYPLLMLQNTISTQVFFKIRDIFATLELAIRSKKNFELFIGMESIYTLAGIILRKMGKVNKVVYYVSDYSPNRYGNSLFNNVYLWLDRVCCYHTNYIWDVSPAMHPARIKAGLKPSKSAPVILVPNALFKEQISPLPLSKKIPLSLVYAGTLTKSNGPDLAVEAMHYVLEKFPKSSLHIFGSNGADQARIKSLIQKYSLDKSVVFHGFITQVADITNAINVYSIGVAPYLDTPGSHRKYGDATKLRLYLGAGLPIITTSIPPLGKEIEKIGAAIRIKDNPEALASAIIDLMHDKKKYNKMRKAAIAYSKQNTWKKTYSNALSQMVLPTKS